MANTAEQKKQIARINRKLAKNYEKLHTSRGWRESQNLGEHHVVDIYRNIVVRSHVNLDSLETELGDAKAAA